MSDSKFSNHCFDDFGPDNLGIFFCCPFAGVPTPPAPPQFGVKMSMSPRDRCKVLTTRDYPGKILTQPKQNVKTILCKNFGKQTWDTHYQFSMCFQGTVAFWDIETAFLTQPASF